jgi:hypothetical protein
MDNKLDTPPVLPGQNCTTQNFRSEEWHRTTLYRRRQVAFGSCKKVRVKVQGLMVYRKLIQLQHQHKVCILIDSRPADRCMCWQGNFYRLLP